MASSSGQPAAKRAAARRAAAKRAAKAAATGTGDAKPQGMRARDGGLSVGEMDG